MTGRGVAAPRGAGLLRTRGRRWLVGAALIVCAALLSVITPSDDDVNGPFMVHVDGPARAESRLLSAQVVSASFADRIVSDGGEWEADGNWLAVELRAAAELTEEDAEIGLAALEIDGVVFHASERVPDTLRHLGLHLGTDTTGFLVFELPDGIRGGEGELRLSTAGKTPRLDEMLAVDLPLDGVPRAEALEISEPAVGVP